MLCHLMWQGKDKGKGMEGKKKTRKKKGKKKNQEFAAAMKTD